MKFNIEEIQSVLSQKIKDSNVINSIVSDLEKVAKEKKEEMDEIKVPKKKNEFAIIVIDEEGEFKDKNLTGFVVKYKEGGDSGAILSKLSDASRSFNDTKKGKKAPLTSMYEIFGHLKAKFLKMTGAGIIIQTKEPVRIIISNNKLV